MGPANGTPPSNSTFSPVISILNSSLWSLDSAFWGADVRVYYALGGPEAQLMNATPIHYVRWPGGAVADQYNASANRIWADGGVYSTPASSETQFVAWCQLIDCHAIIQLPGEINDAATAAYYVAYTEQTLKFHPTYWEIGNEPAQWKHFGVAWPQWKGSQNQNATPGSYAWLVQNYTHAIRAVDPKARIIGLPGVGTGSYNEDVWIRATVALNGPNLSAVAIHVYPAGGSTSSPATAAGFFATLSGKSSIEYRVPSDRQAIATACPTCHGIQIFVTELGTGTQGGPYSRYMSGFSAVVYLSAEMAQAMLGNLPNVDLFAFQASYNDSLLTVSGTPSPIYSLYSKLFPLLQPVVLNVSVSSGPTHFYLVPAHSFDGTVFSLFVVNANLTANVKLDLLGMGFPVLGSGVAMTWNSTSSTPVSTSWTLLAPSLWNLPPRSVAVFQITV